MIDLAKTVLPQTIQVSGSTYRIHTDFKYFLLFSRQLKDKNATYADFDFMYIDEPLNKIEAFNKLLEFMSPIRELPRKTRKQNKDIVIDYDTDSDLIYSAFMDVYKINLLSAKLHWYEFLALFDGLHDTELNKVIGYRLWENDTGKNDSYTRQMQELHDIWRLRQVEDDKDDEELDDFMKRLRG